MYLYDPSTGTWYQYTEPERPSYPTGNTSPPQNPSYHYNPGANGDPASNNQGPTITALPRTQSAPSEGPLKLGPGSSASANFANLTRAQWRDYQRRFVPIEDELINSTTYANPEVLTKAIGQGKEAVNKSFDVANASQSRAVGQYGIRQDPAELALRRRMEGLNRSAAIVDAANRIRQRIADRNREITTGAAPSSGIQMQGDQ